MSHISSTGQKTIQASVAVQTLTLKLSLQVEKTCQFFCLYLKINTFKHQHESLREMTKTSSLTKGWLSQRRGKLISWEAHSRKTQVKV